MSADLQGLNIALVRIGANPLSSAEDPSAAQHLVVWTSVIRRLGASPWSFFKAKRRLVRLAAAPEPAHYKYAYELPTDRLSMPRAIYADAELRAPCHDFEVVGNELWCDEPQLWMSYMRMPPWERMPGDFQELLLTAAMAELALSVREDRPLHDRLYAKAFGTPSEKGFGGMMAVCLENDAQGQVSKPIDGGANPLVDVRW